MAPRAKKAGKAPRGGALACHTSTRPLICIVNCQELHYHIYMFRFFLKKIFIDIWDNLFYIVVCNLISIVAVIVSYLVFSLVYNLPFEGIWKLLLVLLSVIFGCVLCFSLGFAQGSNALKIANFSVPRYRNYFSAFKESFKDAALFGILIGFVTVVLTVSMSYYLDRWINTRSYIWLFFLAFLFWLVVATILAFQWLLPLRSMLHNNLLKCIKKSYIVLLDNTGFTLAVALIDILNIVLTVVTFGLFPGMSGLVIINTNAMRILMYKYDWIEVNPNLTRKEQKNVPWDDLLAKDKRLAGTIKELFFPWRKK